MPSQPLVTYFLAPSQCSLSFSVPLHNVMYTLLALRVIIGGTLLLASLSRIKTYQHPPGHYGPVSVSQEGALEALGRLMGGSGSVRMDANNAFIGRGIPPTHARTCSTAPRMGLKATENLHRALSAPLEEACLPELSRRGTAQ